MKKYYIFTGLIAIFSAITFLNFSTSPTPSNELELIQRKFQHDLNELGLVMNQYKNIGNQFEATEKSIRALQRAHIQTRLAFKKVEYLLAYNDQESVNRFLNGAPLPKVEPAVPEVRVIDPKRTPSIG